MEADPSPAFSIEPLHDRHDRAAFASGVAELDRYLHTQARQDAKRSVAAPFVLLEQGSVVIGYYTLSASGIRLTDLSAEAAKKLPQYPVLPATLLGRLAISEKRQGQKLGQFLLMDALRRSMENTRSARSAFWSMPMTTAPKSSTCITNSCRCPVRRESCSWRWRPSENSSPHDVAARHQVHLYKSKPRFRFDTL